VLLTRSLTLPRCGAYIACAGLAAAPLSPAPTTPQPQPHTSPASRLPPVAASLARCCSRPLISGRSQARAAAGLACIPPILLPRPCFGRAFRPTDERTVCSGSSGRRWPTRSATRSPRWTSRPTTSASNARPTTWTRRSPPASPFGSRARSATRRRTWPRRSRTVDVDGYDYLAAVDTAGPYVNFHPGERYFVDTLDASAVDSGYGALPDRDTSVVVEHTSANPTGPVHVGRARNPIVGDAVANLLSTPATTWTATTTSTTPAARWRCSRGRTSGSTSRT